MDATSTASVAVSSCLDILRRTSPRDVDQNLNILVDVLNSIGNNESAKDLVERTKTPLKDESDIASGGRKYLICESNRDGERYRSPWSNKYYPLIEKTQINNHLGVLLKPSQRLRDLEIRANEIFSVYCNLYYHGSEISSNTLSSVYLRENIANHDSTFSFKGSFLIRKMLSEDEYIKLGYWNSIHEVQVITINPSKALYKLHSTVLLFMEPNSSKLGRTNISGSLSKHVEETHSTGDFFSHVGNIGKMIENVEIEMRSNMDSLYIQKTKEVVECLRKMEKLPNKMMPVFGNKKHGLMLNQAILARSSLKKAE